MVYHSKDRWEGSEDYNKPSGLALLAGYCAPQLEWYDPRKEDLCYDPTGYFGDRYEKSRP